jgi:serine/threonine-protein kinase
MPLSAGESFAGFTIVGLLGSGGIGEVYLAAHPRLPRRDALKVLQADVSADPEYRARFSREADLASTLWHPHIVSVHGRGEYNGQLWISMHYVDRLDAGRLLASRYPAGMPTDHAVRIVTAVASALGYAHKRRLLHRGVKPANVMLTPVWVIRPSVPAGPSEEGIGPTGTSQRHDRRQADRMRPALISGREQIA